jgi:manganese/iron transport system substrate-binding protein
VINFRRKKSIKRLSLAASSLAVLVILAACTGPGAPAPLAIPDGKLQVVATTTILGDVVGQIGGEAIDLNVLLPSGSDPHTFEPGPKDIAAIANADLVMINGAGLEEFMDRLLEGASAGDEDIQLVSASEGIDLLTLAEDHAGDEHIDEDGAENDHPEQEHPDDEGHGEFDPHVWFNPRNVVVWTENIERALSAADPKNAAAYAAKARAYRAELLELDEWIEAQVARIPPDNRLLVTDHQTFGYFAERYGFVQVGAVIPGFSSASAPSAQELGSLQEKIHALGARAIFIGSTVNPAISEQIARDTGIQLVPLYTDSLTAPSGEAGSYLELMRYDVKAILAALSENHGSSTNP